MSNKEVTKFLQTLHHQPELLSKLQTIQKPEVLNYAYNLGYHFTQQEFDDTVWQLEGFLANKLGEEFNLKFSLWETMWGKYYLEFVVNNVIGCLSKQDINNFLNHKIGE